MSHEESPNQQPVNDNSTAPAPTVEQFTSKIFALLARNRFDEIRHVAFQSKVPREVVEESVKRVITLSIGNGRGVNMLWLAEQFFLSKELFTSPEVQGAAEKGISTCLSRGEFDYAAQIAKDCKIPEESLQDAASGFVAYFLETANTEKALRLIATFKIPQSKLINPRIEAEVGLRLTALCSSSYVSDEGLNQILRLINHCSISEELLRTERVQQFAEIYIKRDVDQGLCERAMSIAKCLKIPKSFVDEKARARMTSVIMSDRIDIAEKIRDEFGLQESDLQEAAKEAIMNVVRYSSQGLAVSRISTVMESCKIPANFTSSTEFKDAAKDGVATQIIRGDTDFANKIIKLFKLPELVIHDAIKIGMRKVFNNPDLHLGKKVDINALFRIAEAHRLPESDIQEIAREGLLVFLKNGYFEPAHEVTQAVEMPEEVLLATDIQTAARIGLILVIGRFQPKSDQIRKIAKRFKIGKAVIQEAAGEAITNILSAVNEDDDDRYDDPSEHEIPFGSTRRIAKEVNLSENALTESATQAAIIWLSRGRIDRYSKVLESFSVQENALLSTENPHAAEIHAAVRQGMLVLVTKKEFDAVMTLAEKFKIQPDEDPLNFLFDKSIPEAIRHEPSAYEPDVSAAGRRARLTHALNPGDFAKIEKEFPEALKLKEGKPNWEAIAQAIEEIGRAEDDTDQIITECFGRARDYFGPETAIRYANRANLTPHDAYFFMPQLINFLQMNDVPLEHGRQLLREVARDGSGYEEGTAHHRLASVTQRLAEGSIGGIIAEAARYPNIRRLQELVNDFASEGFNGSWKQFKKLADVLDLLGQSEILKELSGGEMSDRLRTYIEKLAFHPNISTKAVIEFWKEPARFLEINDEHTDDYINESKKPANYLSLPFLGLTGEDLRDALVDGSLDELQTLPAFEQSYELFDTSSDDYNNPAALDGLLRKALGSRVQNISGTAASVSKLFHQINQIFKQAGATYEEWRDGTFSLEMLTLEQRTALVNALFTEDVGTSRPQGQHYRVKLGRKSDPEMVVAGNDTASCMPFGSGKNNVYMFNPNCTQLVVQRRMADGVWRTAAQSVMSLDTETGQPTPNLIAAYGQQDRHIKNLISANNLATQPVITCDNIEIAKNEEGGASTFIRLAYERFFIDYLRTYGDKLGVDQTRVIAGSGYTPVELGFRSVPNTFIPLAPMGYSDNIHPTCLMIEGREGPVQRLQTGVSEMTTRDVLAVAMLEGKAYADNKTLLENLHGMQNNIIGMQIANTHFKRPELSFVYRDDQSVPRGYVLAYEGSNGGLSEIYLSDLAADPESKLAGGRLIQALFSAIKDNYGSKGKPFIPIFTNARDKTSYKILERQMGRLAEQSGLLVEMEVLGTEGRGEDLFHDVRIYIGRTPEEIVQQKAKYRNSD